jgi:branched-chain amino acid transport system permease protein
VHAGGLGLGGALAAACGGMIAFALLFTRVVVRPLVGRPLIALVMVTLGLAALLRGAMPFAFAGIPRRLDVPIASDALAAYGLLVAPEKVVAAAVAVVAIVAIASFFHWSRTGIALRAIADDQQSAIAMGIDVPAYLGVAWAGAGVIAVLAGALSMAVGGGGMGLVVLGAKVFPIVVIGGLDSVAGTIVAAVVIGMLESLVAGYLDPIVGAGFHGVASYVALIAMLCVRPYGLFGRADVARV